MALDKSRDNDEKYEIDGFQYVVDKEFMEKAKPIKIDYSETGFKLDSSIEIKEECSGCGTTSDCC